MKHWRDVRPVLAAFWQAQPRRLALGAALALLTVLMGMGLLGLSGWFISATALAGLQAATALRFDVFMPSAGIRLLALGRTGSRYAERLVTHDATFGVLAALRERLFRGWARPDAARRLLARPARLLFRLTADIDALESFYLRLLVPAIAALGAALFAGVVLGFMNAWIGVALALWLVMAGWGIALAVAVRGRPASLRRAHAMEALRARAADLVSGQTELVMAGRSEAQCEALAAADRHLANADHALNRLEVRAGMAYGMAGTLTLVAVLLAAAALVGDGAIGAPAAALALLVALTALEPFAALRRGALEAGRAWLAARRLARRLAPDLPAEVAATAWPAAPSDAGLALCLARVVAAHPGSRVPALRDISLTLATGERVALVGPSGAGKSTLLALVAGEFAAASGEVRCAPHCLLTQRTELFQDSLRDNLRLADPGAGDARLWAALQAAGLSQEVRATAAGLDTPLGEGGLGLSGGQSRRLALARLMLRDVPLWLLDEPTEALDTATAHDVLQRLDAQAAGHTLLVATHLRREAALAHRLISIQDGRITADLRRGTAAFDAALKALRPD
ncbi:amino acid ABC transporter ATP-binding/permease protein [Variovorax ginsengisoli]|uniref:ATP-binding cassette domain-containing protein n=1 Tax=Variovorax ginsengisoli TaxID=363844 RepID=A0ABT8SEJ4_9BURK|nr:ATP-binding cassette domain-containing protein [Variovorax ginsengisoli]MDN8617623.1 ATP-binding cassette domain-containing protein [Variovorax ginsengisoli]MDO1536793.1 ATP-binding cassette domain-containing protein [Variovorax ginsengisoli]